MEVKEHQKAVFLETLWEYYSESSRNTLPWRQPEPNGSFDPYKIIVSELMLQQTQVARVVPKYHAFLARFPNVESLAAAELGEVLKAWQGLGYNRRAKFLWQAAQKVQAFGTFPNGLDELVRLPGVGRNTAGAIMTYAFNQPVIFVETNVRTVYIHHFFADQTGIHDKEILELVEQTLDHEHPREFYWALMDYGSYLKATVGNLNTASKHYAKQSAFEGSRRQVRGAVLRMLDSGAKTIEDLRADISDKRLESVLQDLVKEGLIQEVQGTYCL